MPARDGNPRMVGMSTPRATETPPYPSPGQTRPPRDSRAVTGVGAGGRCAHHRLRRRLVVVPPLDAHADVGAARTLKPLLIPVGCWSRKRRKGTVADCQPDGQIRRGAVAARVGHRVGTRCGGPSSDFEVYMLPLRSLCQLRTIWGRKRRAAMARGDPALFQQPAAVVRLSAREPGRLTLRRLN